MTFCRRPYFASMSGSENRPMSRSSQAKEIRNIYSLCFFKDNVHNQTPKLRKNMIKPNPKTQKTEKQKRVRHRELFRFLAAFITNLINRRAESILRVVLLFPFFLNFGVRFFLGGNWVSAPSFQPLMEIQGDPPAIFTARVPLSTFAVF